MKKTAMLAIAMLLLAGGVASAKNVRCESTDGRYHECRTDPMQSVKLVHQFSSSSCVEGQSWGVRNGLVWVDRGCRAEFTMAPAPYAQSAVPAVLTCESVNNTRHTCRANTLAGVTLSRQLSKNACIEGRSWGTSNKGVWVDRGCRAEFLVGGAVGTQQAYGQTIQCGSNRRTRQLCAADTSRGVQLTRQISNRDCQLGRDWGYDQQGVWVANGCNAEFTIGSGSYAPMTSGSEFRPSVVCESENGRRTYCRADTSMGVSLSRQLSDASCVQGQTWNYDRDGIWVSAGCRAEFRLDH